jgi:hypothetical protein
MVASLPFLETTVSFSLPFSYVENRIGRPPLRKQDLILRQIQGRPTHAAGGEKRPRIKSVAPVLTFCQNCFRCRDPSARGSMWRNAKVFALTEAAWLELRAGVSANQDKGGSKSGDEKKEPSKGREDDKERSKNGDCDKDGSKSADDNKGASPSGEDKKRDASKSGDCDGPGGGDGDVGGTGG